MTKKTTIIEPVPPADAVTDGAEPNPPGSTTAGDVTQSEPVSEGPTPANPRWTEPTPGVAPHADRKTVDHETTTFGKFERC